MISKLSLIFGSKTKTQEIILLLQDKKEVVIHAYLEKELPLIIQFCQENNLHLVKSRFKIIFNDKSNYSNSGLKIPENDPRQGYYFTYFSKEEKKALLASYYETTSNHQELGKILGYPQCCINFFCEKFNENKTNLELLPTNSWTNLSQREHDIVLLSHFPCHSDCQDSIQLAKNYFDTIKSIDSRRAEELIRILSISTQSQQDNDPTL
jgi:hypothetical protein